jgi:hypothetical protein
MLTEPAVGTALPGAIVKDQSVIASTLRHADRSALVKRGAREM